MSNVFSGVLLLVLLLTAPAAAADADGADSPVPLNFFDASRAPKPFPGQWIEYRIGYPADPLENSLQPDPAALPNSGDRGEVVALEDGYEIYKPSFDPGASWLVLPLRIEVRQVTPEGCNVFLTFDGASRQFFLAAGGKEQEEPRYDAPAEDADRRMFVTMGGEEYEVEMIRRDGDGYGFVRYFSPEVPFGVFRFATENVDLVMVGFGQGRPPDFPLALDAPIDPPVGLLYGRP